MNAVSYKIKRSTTSGSETTITTTTTTHYTDSPLQNGTTYYYVVSAVDSCGDESANSAEASVTPQYAYAPVFTGGQIFGNGSDPVNIFANNEGMTGQNQFKFTVTGPPNSTWTIYSLPEGNPYNANVSYNTIIGTLTIGPSGTQSFTDPNAGTFDWSSQFYQLLSGDVSSAIFGYNVTDVPPPDGGFGSPVTNPLIPAGNGTVADALPGENIFWHSSTGEVVPLNNYNEEGQIYDGVFFDDSTQFGNDWDGDFEWDDGNQVWWGYSTLWNASGQWDPTGYVPASVFPYGYSDTYWFFNLPDASYSDYYDYDHGLVSFVGFAPW